MLPETPAVAAALSVAERHFSPALLNHSVRTYAWAAMYRQAHGIACDEELLCVGSLLHDIALTPSFDSHTVAFEEAGGDLARVFAYAAGWPPPRSDRLAEIIVLHMRGDVSADADPEAHVLQVATSFEIVGRHADEFPPDARTATVRAYPRLGFSSEFLSAFEDQAGRKPHCAAAASIRQDLATRITGNPLDA
ncbi:HD domain-containing protein [Dactylosporangium sp. AC04546]|uniref:HD domain-containing protein n=1 Tax=Dactylosporangium sp. AC04546 TaxID=2862460 RepID=UPI001EDD70C7|nr:HD domain-containing protein [Dactylosporangium sp. AC04546]WVK88203.1 HD domain-containing protein [Dactylosporangium sp. AC04546]